MRDGVDRSGGPFSLEKIVAVEVLMDDSKSLGRLHWGMVLIGIV